MRRAFPWILLLVFLGLGLVVFLEAGGDAPVQMDLDRDRSERAEPSLRGSQRLGRPAEAGTAGKPVAGSGEAAATRLDPYPVQGRTRFQQRLSAGDELQRVREAVEADRLPADAATQRVREFANVLLWHDAVQNLRPPDLLARPNGGTQVLRFLTEPRRDTSGLSVHGVEEKEDALGSNLRVRIWTRGNSMSPGAVRGADDLIARLDSHAGVLDEDGYDVLATPGMGNDVFPPQTFSWPFSPAGYYAQVDDLCVIGTRRDAAFLSLVLKHELVHAWQHRRMPGLKSRFAQEGLAEYLSRLQPGDYALEVPPARLGNELAALLQMLQRMRQAGVSWRGLVPGRLLDLPPLDFYKLGHLGYLLGLASMAFVGGETIERAVRMPGDPVLAASIRGIEWPAFLAFLGEHAAGGDPAQGMWVQDGRYEDTPAKRGYGGAARVLRGLGVSVPAGVSDRRIGKLMERALPFPAQDPARLASALETLLAGEGRVLFLADATQSMEQTFRASDARSADGDPILPGLLDANTRQAFAVLLHEAIKRGAKQHPVVTGCLTTSAATCAWPTTLSATALTFQRVPEWVRLKKGTGAALVVLVASPEMQRGAVRDAIARAMDEPPGDVEEETLRRVLADLLADLLDKTGVAPTTVLVVDLADGESDALALAEAFFAHLGDGANVAYWNPQRALR